MGRAFKERPVHEGARVALIGIANNIFILAPRLGNRRPFETCRIAGTASSPQTAFGDQLNQRCRPLGADGFKRREIAASEQVVRQIVGINAAGKS